MHCWKFKEGYAMLPMHIRKVVISWYLKKEKLKAEYSDTQEYRDAKAFVNSIFGMMCTALYLEEFILDGDEIEGVKNKSYEECCRFLFLSPYWGFWITSHARAMLVDVICRFPSVIVQYDTDSVYFRDKGEVAEKLRKYLNDFNRKTMIANKAKFLGDEHMLSIGTWTFDPMFKRFKALGAKRYMYETQNGKIKCVVAGCRKSKKKETEGKSTIEIQNTYNNLTRNENVDVFDFFTHNMEVDENHSEKMCSVYVDEHVRFESTDSDGNQEEIDIPSCIVLKPIPFKMKLGRSHKSLLKAVKRMMDNSGNKEIHTIWKELRKLNTSRTTQI